MSSHYLLLCVHLEADSGLFLGEHYNFSFLMLRVLPLNWTVGMVGVLAGTVEDAMIVSVFYYLVPSSITSIYTVP